MSGTIEVGGLELTYREQGTGRPAVLLVHGAGASSLAFAELVRRVGRERRVVALDLPGHGRSAPFAELPADRALIDAYREIVAEAAERLGLGRFVFVGHSMGGAIGQEFALAYPDRLAGLVLVATAAKLGASAVTLAAIANHFEQLPKFLAQILYSPATDRQVVEAWAAEQIQTTQPRMLRDFEACNAFDARERVARIDVPTTVISGADDLLTPPKGQRFLAETIPGARLEVITRAGHCPFRERPDEVARIVLEAAAGDGG